ncbi:Rne/Rng family ribonuclease [Bacillus salitolerans]|uniref:Rne/Rng family ribonuclease n=1 Tax=Bacillus salitolerans TaxID=1437434 RepID=A0ABW4LLH4_9BACI
MKRTVIMNLMSNEKRVAVLENSKVAEFHFDDPYSEDMVGNIYLGRVTRVMPGMQAAFVDIGLEKNGFIHRDQLMSFHLSDMDIKERKNRSISEFVHEGEALMVQVEKNSVGTKGPKLTNLVEISSSLVIYLPHGNYLAVSKKIESEKLQSSLKDEIKSFISEPEGIIVRTASKQASLQEIKDEINLLRNEYEEIVKVTKLKKPPVLLKKERVIEDKIIRELGQETIEKIIVDEANVFGQLKKLYPSIEIEYHRQKENIFAHFNLEHELEKMIKKIVWLKNGSYLIIDHTEALTVIDVNTGKFTGNANLKDTVLRTNEQAAIEIARQIRLRDIGGIILVDFIDMKSESDRETIVKALKHELIKDRTRTVIYGFTQLGILEMTRKRLRENITEQQTTTCPTCRGTSVVLSSKSIAFKLERELMELKGQDMEAVWVEATKDVSEVLMDPTEKLLDRIQQSIHIKLYFTEIIRSKPEYIIRHIGTDEDARERINRS